MTNDESMPKSRFTRYIVFLVICLFLTLNVGSNFFSKSLAPQTQTTAHLVPGATWTADNTGHHIQAHGGGVIKVDDTFYWIGEDKSNGTFFQNINCYSSTDLVQWSFEGALLSQQASDELGPQRIVERPKVLFNEESKAYVMYVHIDDSLYKEAKVGVATSKDGVCGQYHLHHSFRPLDRESRDLGLFKDFDGTAYLMTEDRKSGLHIHRLSKDYLSVIENVYTFPQAIESPAMIYVPDQRKYFIFGSHLTGWRPNDNVYSTATSLSGPWSEWKIFSKAGSLTYTSQTSFVLPFVGSSIAGHTQRGQQAIVWMGDRWDPENLMRSTYVWLPLEIESDENGEPHVAMPNLKTWAIDARTGDWNAQAAEPLVYDAEDTALLGNAEVVACDLCESKKAIKLTNGGGLRIDSILSRVGVDATILLYYLHDAKAEQFATVGVNGQVPMKLAFLPSGNFSTDGVTEGTFVSSTVRFFHRGDNSIEVRVSDGCNIVLDKVEVIVD